MFSVGRMSLNVRNILLGAVVSLLAGPAHAAPPTVEQLEQAFAALEDARGALSGERSDPQAVLEKAGRDPQKLFEWVRDNTHWAPYRGALRGSAGVLMDRVGSSLDRSLLLADLLRAAGFDVRLARGAAPEAVAGRIREIPANWLDALDPAGADKAAVDADAQAKALRDAALIAEKAMQARATAHAESLLKTLAPVAKPDEAKQRAAAERAAALADHWWVQMKRGDAWVDADVLAADAKLGDRVAEATATMVAPPEGRVTSLPADQIHTVEIKLIIERLDAGKLTELVPATTTLRAADMHAERVIVTHMPIGYKPAGPEMEKNRAALGATAEFMPMIYVGPAVVFDKSVSDTGALRAAPSLDKTGGLASSTGSVIGGIGGGLTGEEPVKDSGIWTAEWIELTVNATGRPARTIRREVFDLIGPAARAGTEGSLTVKMTDALRLDRALALVGMTDMLVQAAHLPAEFLAHQYAQELLKTKRRVLQAAAAPAPANGASRVGMIGSDPSRLVLSPLCGITTGRLAASSVAGDVYIDSPNVFCLTRRHRVGADGKLLVQLRADLAINNVAARGGTDPFGIRVRQGVADTIVEAAVVEQLTALATGAKPDRAVNTANIFDSAGNAQPLVLSRGVDPSALAAWPANARARAAKAIVTGDVLIAAAAPAGAADSAIGWWQVDPATGSTIGVTGDGYHEATTERTQVESVVNRLLDLPFRLTVGEMQQLSRAEFLQMVAGGKGLGGMQLLRVFQQANRLFDLILIL